MIIKKVRKWDIITIDWKDFKVLTTYARGTVFTYREGGKLKTWHINFFWNDDITEGWYYDEKQQQWFYDHK